MSLSYHFENGHHVLSGDLAEEEINSLREFIKTVEHTPLVFDLRDVEISSGVAMVECITWLRELSLDRDLVLWFAPQMLAHSLYKTNILQQGRITLHEPRFDSGIGV